MSIKLSRASSSASVRQYLREASIVLIGIRGVGKTTLGQFTATALGWLYVDLHAVFEAREKPIVDFIHEHGWEKFREVESQILDECLTTYPTKTVIDCGGGIVDWKRNRLRLQLFKEDGIVIHIMREKDRVLKQLDDSMHYPTFLHETAVEAWDRRVILLRECCSFGFMSLTVDTLLTSVGSSVTHERSLALKPVEKDFCRQLKFIHGVDTNKVPAGTHQPHILSLTYEDVMQAIPVLDELSLGIDLWELRADLLCSLDFTFLASQVAILRRHSNLPILFTLRTISQGGKYPDPTDETSATALRTLLRYALRLGVEYLDLQFTLPKEVFTGLVARKRNTTIIGSYNHCSQRLSWMSDETRQIYDTLVERGSDIVMIINNVASTSDDQTALRQFISSVGKNSIPLIAANMLMQGNISRAYNASLFPVCHPLLPFPAIPGQPSYIECQKFLHMIGNLKPLEFYLFGNPIAESMSSTLHKTAFDTLGLPYSYKLHSTDTVKSLLEVLKHPFFGGASIETPYKQSIMQFLHPKCISRQARLIRTVNTITPGPGGQLFGDNTDWLAIKRCIERCITPANAVTRETTALVIGAGGAARATLFALYSIGVVNVFVYNRSRLHAEKLADAFNKLDSLFRVQVLDSLSVPLPIQPPPTIIVSAVPAVSKSPVGLIKVDVGLQPEHLSQYGGVAVEMAYHRRVTKLLALADGKKDRGWVSVEGIELLLEQGYEQFRIFTGKWAPKTVVRKEVLSIYERNVACGFTGF